ncbi:hypothetical protein [Paenibacillus aestuarii]|uniref:Uncharacterized protein n=1 Tax=Paenibacillus aestuarii TaxID=516965 RepID=A0ABW0KDG3_9BACL|nr:hypothetical protein [Paenibacillus aestuarii]
MVGRDYRAFKIFFLRIFFLTVSYCHSLNGKNPVGMSAGWISNVLQSHLSPKVGMTIGILRKADLADGKT